VDKNNLCNTIRV